MRILFLLLTFTTLSFGQNAKSRNLLTNKTPCTFEMSIKQLISNKLSFNCPEVFENKPFGVQDFKIKFFGNPSIEIPGNSLNEQSKIIAKKLKAGDIVTIYDVQNITTEKSNNQDYNTLMIKIID